MADSLTLIVLLHLEPEHRADYERFEAAASRIMARHGGRIERRLDMIEVGGISEAPPECPDEIHVVTFPGARDFEAYLQDPELATLGELRTRAIRRTVVWSGRDLPRFT